MNYINKDVLVVGKGISGMGAKYALERLGANVFIIDSTVDSDFFSDKLFSLIVISPSIDKDNHIYEYARQKNIELISEIELGFRLYGGEIIAITGTNGKTTTTSLIGSIFTRAGYNSMVCGNIGISFAESAVKENSDIAALEVSSFQLECVDLFKPKIACILNISQDHLDRHKSMDIYAEQKLNIAKKQDENDFLILSQDDIPLYTLKNFNPQGQVLYTSTRGKVKGAYLLNGDIYFLDEFILKREHIKLEGQHNVANCLFAIACAKLYNIDNDIIRCVLSEFSADDHRLKFVDRINGKNYYNDSKGTNIGATIKALDAMIGSTDLIMGGKDKGYCFDELFSVLPKKVNFVYAIGETADKIIESAYKFKFYDIEKASSLLEAVTLASKGMAENVLLSPATSSFDMFKDYKHRGEEFVKIVKGLS